MKKSNEYLEVEGSDLASVLDTGRIGQVQVPPPVGRKVNAGGAVWAVRSRAGS